MFDDFDCTESYEDYTEDGYLDAYWEDQTDLECGFNPYMGCYDWDC